MTITIDSTWPQWILEVKLFPNFGFLLIFFRGPVEMCWAQFNGWSERRIVCKRFETKDRRISTGNPIRPTSGCVNFEAKETQFWTSQKRQFSSKALWSAMIVWGGTCLSWSWCSPLNLPFWRWCLPMDWAFEQPPDTIPKPPRKHLVVSATQQWIRPIPRSRSGEACWSELSPFSGFSHSSKWGKEHFR